MTSIHEPDSCPDLEALESEYRRLQAESEQLGPGPFEVGIPEGEAAWMTTRMAEVAGEKYAAAAGIPAEHSVQCDAERLADLAGDAGGRAGYEALSSDPEAS